MGNKTDLEPARRRLRLLHKQAEDHLKAHLSEAKDDFVRGSCGECMRRRGILSGVEMAMKRLGARVDPYEEDLDG